MARTSCETKTVFLNRASAAKAEYRKLALQHRSARQWRIAEGETEESVAEVVIRGRMKGLARLYGQQW